MALFSNSGLSEEFLDNFEPELQEIILFLELPPVSPNSIQSTERELLLLPINFYIWRRSSPPRSMYSGRLKRIKVARDLGLNERQVIVWFQNRCMKDKKARSIKDDKDAEKDPKTAPPDTQIGWKKETRGNQGRENQMHTLNYSSNSSTDIPHHHLSSWNSTTQFKIRIIKILMVLTGIITTSMNIVQLPTYTQTKSKLRKHFTLIIQIIALLIMMIIIHLVGTIRLLV
ncbi:hypothetical protein KQX54_005437 [Cotesia glomerata]|uniref:Homeobox domain-containing protein n=1 Tax=Cotesia glomerata TaxID=32391 RepID=A0AAV7ITK2_COTGL|nr:hypothetical protein KQX54_005437 [Cotesia glomerata]